MAGSRGRGRRGRIPAEEVPHHDRTVQDVMIEDLQRFRSWTDPVEQVLRRDRNYLGRHGRVPDEEVHHPFHEEETYESDSSFDNPYHNRGQRWERRGQVDYRRDLGFKVELPEFSGTLQAEGFIDWMNEVERIFEYKEVPDAMKVKLVGIKLKGRASAWWEQLKRSRERQGRSKVTEWEKMKKKMESHFLPFGYTQSLYK